MIQMKSWTWKMDLHEKNLELCKMKSIALGRTARGLGEMGIVEVYRKESQPWWGGREGDKGEWEYSATGIQP